MKKLKLILPIICSGTTLLTATTALTGCKDPQHETNYLYLTNGDTHLISGVTSRGAAYEGQAWNAWKAIDENGKEVKDVYYDIMPLSEGDFNHIHVGVSSGIVYWDNTTPVGNYKFKVVAAYDKDGTTVRAVSDVVTLEVTRQTKVKIPEGNDATCNLLSTDRGTYFVLKGFEIANGIGIDLHSIESEINAGDFGIVVDETCEDKKLGKLVYSDLIEETDWMYSSDSYRRFDLYGYFENDNLSVGDHTLKVTLTYEPTSNPMVLNKEFTVHSSFSTDSWANLGKQAAKGLDHLKEYYGVDSFVGLTKTVMINDRKHRVMVVGENQDIDENNKKVPLTFQFIDVICDKAGYPLRTRWAIPKKGEESTQPNYWKSNINDALTLDGEMFENWYVDGEKEPTQLYRSSVFNMMPNDVRSYSKNIKRDVLCYSEDTKSYEIVTNTTKMFLPSLNSFFSDEGILSSSDYKYFTDEKVIAKFAAENEQYQYYKKIIVDETGKDGKVCDKEYYDVYLGYDLSMFDPVFWSGDSIDLALTTPTQSKDSVFYFDMYDQTDCYVYDRQMYDNLLCVTPLFGI